MTNNRWNSPARRPGIADHVPTWGRLLILQALPIVTLAQTLTGFGSVSTGGRVLSIGLVAVLAGAWGVLTSRRRGDTLDVLALIVVIGIGAWLNVLTGDGQVFAASYSALFIAPFWYGMPRAVLPASCGVLAVTLSTMFVGHPDIAGGIGNGFGALFFGFAALFWGRIMRASERNAQLVDELQESRDAEQRNAVVAERSRLARELHDVLAHTLSSLALHLESTRALGKAREIDPEVLSRIERAVSLARDGLEEARNAVGTLRDDDLPGPERLPSLVAEFEHASGVECRFEQVGEPTALAPNASVALFRGAQEALTNVGKHAAATRVDVRLEWDDGRVTLRVIDDGTPRNAASARVGGGNGLRGMRERAELAGGQVDAGPTSSGFAVELRLPA